jgi:hypothetical protein
MSFVFVVHRSHFHSDSVGTRSPQHPTPHAWQAAQFKFLHFDPSTVSVWVRNVSGKKIVGLTLNAALADATEHWKWYHWNFDDARPAGIRKSRINQPKHFLGNARTLILNTAAAGHSY